MENCLSGPINAGRTVLLVSHHTALVSPAAAYIIALENVSIKPFVPSEWPSEMTDNDRAISNFRGLEKSSSLGD